MNFRQALRSAYLRSPCQVLPNPLWKTLAALEAFEADCVVEFDATGNVTHLEAWQGSRLLVYWDAATRFTVPAARLAQMDFALLHHDYLPFVEAARFSRQEAYFRLSRPLGPPVEIRMPPGFELRPARPDEESGAISALIAQCYPDLRPSPADVSAWASHPAFAPELWVWVWDRRLRCPAGLGIAELDRSAGEGALEWVQLLPAYRGRGLGKALVLELMNIMGQMQDAAIATVSGLVDNITRPERLYRACGFKGNDAWFVLEK